MTEKSKRRSILHFRTRSSTPDSTYGTSESTSSISPQCNVPKSVDEASMDHEDSSLRTRTRVLTKPYRASTFGSRHSLHSLREEEKGLTTWTSRASSTFGDPSSPINGTFGDQVKKSGEVQVAAVQLFRKRTQYIVLTESHLIRFKNQSKAAEMFPAVPNVGRHTLPRSMSSLGSYTDLQHTASNDSTEGVSLDEIIAAYTIEDSKPCFSIEVAYLDEQYARGSILQLHFTHPSDAMVWLELIRSGRNSNRRLHQPRNVQSVVRSICRMLEKNNDYDPAHFDLFKVSHRSTSLLTARTMDSKTKPESCVAYLVVGVHKIYIVQHQNIDQRASGLIPTTNERLISYGLMSLISLKVDPQADSFVLHFHNTMQQAYTMSLASCEVEQIAVCLQNRSVYLCPHWTISPFRLEVPPPIEDLFEPAQACNDEDVFFDRALVAFCAALEVDSSRIYYSVDYDCEDAPCFSLLLPSSNYSYSAMELLAVLRALQFNETFVSISFANVDLSSLRKMQDASDPGPDGLLARSNIFIELPGHSRMSILQKELRALALRSRRLRRIDFTNSFNSLRDNKRISCGIPEALTPLCKRSLTNVDWLIFNGVPLSDRDVNFLVDAASERQCHLRALEVGDCGLAVNDVDVIISTLRTHEDTIEVLDISGVQGRFSPELFSSTIGSFGRIRKLNLTRVQKTAGFEPLIAPEILLSWKLESLKLDGTPLNEQSVDSISAYLASSRSLLLRELSFSHCGISGHDLAVFLQSLSQGGRAGREMHVNASNNRLGLGFLNLPDCIARNSTPTSLSMRMIDFEKEVHFRELVEALSVNTTLRFLDISHASLPYDASLETCQALRNTFAVNEVLEELDISGEAAHLDFARFGIGLNIALTGLESNKTLRTLRIEHQKLGLQGASTLAKVIECNTSLREIYCDHNDINLHCFTVLVNALEKNKTLLYLPSQQADRAISMSKVKDEFESLGQLDVPPSPTGGSIRKGTHAVVSKTIHRHHRRQSSRISGKSDGSFTAQDIDSTMVVLSEKWGMQTQRLEQYLRRNYELALDHNLDQTQTEDLHRPTATPNRLRPISTGSLGKVFNSFQISEFDSLTNVQPDSRQMDMNLNLNLNVKNSLSDLDENRKNPIFMFADTD